MARGIDGRLTALEDAGADHGCKLFCGVNGNEYFEIGDDFGCLDALQAAEQGNPQKRRIWAPDDLAALCDSGYTVISVRYTEAWNESEQ